MRVLVVPDNINIDGHKEGLCIIEVSLDGDGKKIIPVDVRDSGEFPEIQETLNSLDEIDWVPAIFDEND